MNSLEEFIPPKEKVAERPTPPCGRFISLRENDAGRFRECFSRKRAFSPWGKFTPLNRNIANNFSSPRNMAGERHVSPAIPVFLKGRPSSPREEVAEKEKPMRRIIPPVVSPG